MKMSMQYTEVFIAAKLKIMIKKYFLIFAQNIDVNHLVEAVHASIHNLCFGAKIIRKIGVPL